MNIDESYWDANATEDFYLCRDTFNKVMRSYIKYRDLTPIDGVYILLTPELDTDEIELLSKYKNGYKIHNENKIMFEFF
jgi:hypothetical protein